MNMDSSLKDTIFAFQQGYVCGVLGTHYNIKMNKEYIEKADGILYELLLEKYGTKTKLFLMFSDKQKEEFKNALKIGINNKIFVDLERDAFVKCAFRKYNSIINCDKYKLIKKLITLDGYEIGDVLFGNREGIPSLIVIRETNCDRCGFEKYCHCFSFTDNNLMLGIRNYHYGTHVCVCCGKFSESIYYKTNYKCSECNIIYDEKIHNSCEYREKCIDKIIEKQLYYKNKGIKCLCCNKKDICAYEGLLVCSDECLRKLIT